MQTEDTISNGHEAYESSLLAGRAPEYQFDQMELAVEIPHRDYVLTIAYRKPETADYLKRQAALGSTSHIVDGALLGNEIKHDADSDFFDLVVTGARKRSSDGIKVAKEYSAEECQRFPYEVKVKFVKRITTWEFRVEASGDDLLGEVDSLVVVQPVGEINGSPVEIRYTMKPLSAKQRQSYENAFKTLTRIKNGKQSLETEPHVIEKAMRLFGGDVAGKDAAFISVERGRLESGPFTEDRKLEFIQQIDPLFQVGVIDAICDYYGGGRD